MSLKRAVKKQYYYCRMGSGGGSYLKIGLGLLEKAVWGVLQKLAKTYHEKEKACQSIKVQILSAVSKMKERKRILEVQAEHCKTNRLDLYYQWKEGRIVKEEYAIRKDELTKDWYITVLADGSIIKNYSASQTDERYDLPFQLPETWSWKYH